MSDEPKVSQPPSSVHTAITVPAPADEVDHEELHDSEILSAYPEPMHTVHLLLIDTPNLNTERLRICGQVFDLIEKSDVQGYLASGHPTSPVLIVVVFWSQLFAKEWSIASVHATIGTPKHAIVIDDRDLLPEESPYRHHPIAGCKSFGNFLPIHHTVNALERNLLPFLRQWLGLTDWFGKTSPNGGWGWPDESPKSDERPSSIP